jgi:starch-binding outer membrane protein, SusD/RagB family
MRPKLIIALSCLAGLASTVACNKFLDPNPTDVLTPDNFYKSSDDAISAVNAAYAQMPYVYLYYFYIGDIAGDDLMADAGFGSDGHQLADYTFDNTLWTLDNQWSNEYITINRANIVIQNVPGITMAAALKARVIGEAKFIRALSYFGLVTMFGDVPLVTTQITSASLAGLPRTPKAQVYQLIETDLQQAAASLPSSYSGADVGRATSGAALALLAKVYLYLGDWNDAAINAAKVINSGMYSLNKNYNDNFAIATQNSNPENVFSVNFGSPETVTGVVGSIALLFGLPSGFPGGDAYGLLFVLPSAVSMFSPTDQRGNGATFMISPYTIHSKVIGDTTITWTAPPGAALHKPLDENDPQNMSSRSWEQQPNYQPIIRYADVLLMYAEAVANGGTANAGTAVAALDQVRLRGDSLATSSALAANFMDTLRVERRKEFIYEGQRWFDLSRWGILNQALTAKQEEILTIYPNEFKSVHGAPVPLFPVPQVELNADPHLTQNPGWN